MAISTPKPTLKYQALEDYQKKLASSTSPASQATSYFQSAAAGKPSAALSTAISSNREALARAAASARSTAAQSIAQGGGLGQGQAVRGTQEAEQGILQSLADSRAKELQLIGQEQQSANETLLNQANTDSSNKLSAIKMGLESGSESTKASTRRALGEYLDSIGLQQADEESAKAFDDYFATEAENDPSALLAKETAQQSLSKTRAENAIASGTGTTGSKLAAAYSFNPSVAYNAFIAGINAPMQQDGDFWDKTIIPLLKAGRTSDAAKMIDLYNTRRNSSGAAGLQTSGYSTFGSAIL